MLRVPFQSDALYCQRLLLDHMGLQKDGYTNGLPVATSLDYVLTSAARRKMDFGIVTSSVDTDSVYLKRSSGLIIPEENNVDCSLMLGIAKKESISRPISSFDTSFGYPLQLRLSSTSSMEGKVVENGCPSSSLRHWMSVANSSAEQERSKCMADWIVPGAKSQESTMSRRSKFSSSPETESCITKIDIGSTRSDGFLVDHGPSLELQLSKPEGRTVLQHVSGLGNQATAESTYSSFSNRRCGSTDISKVRAEVGLKTYVRGGDSTGELPKICAECGTTKTPLWRNGPRGLKSLCNACGIRFKKSGRRMDKGHGFLPATTTMTFRRKLDLNESQSEQCGEVLRFFKRCKLPMKTKNTFDCNVDQESNCMGTTTQCPVSVADCSMLSSSIATIDFFAGRNVSACAEIERTRNDNVKRESSTGSDAEEERAMLLMALSCGLMEA